MFLVLHLFNLVFQTVSIFITSSDSHHLLGVEGSLGSSHLLDEKTQWVR